MEDFFLDFNPPPPQESTGSVLGLLILGLPQRQASGLGLKDLTLKLVTLTALVSRNLGHTSTPHPPTHPHVIAETYISTTRSYI